jgi:hypothetical protein
VTLAHGANSGPNIEALVLGAPLLVLGASLLFQKSANAVAPFVLMGIGAVLCAGSFTFLYRDPHPAAAQKGGGEASYRFAVDGLCLAQQSAAGGEVDQARTVFQDQAHSPLHDIAAAVEERNRAVAGDLLVAMQRVESDFGSSPRAGKLSSDLTTLIDVTGSALDELGIASGGCAL